MINRLSRVLVVVVMFAMTAVQAAEKPILVGLDADLSSGAARSGKSIRRGMELAMDEINAQGGVLGRPLQLIAKDHRGIPARGIDNIADFAAMDGLVAVVGGLHTPVAMKELKSVHKHKLPFLIPWAAGTPVVENGFQPNYVFRVSVRDQYAGGFLVGRALSEGHKKIGLLLERTGWGKSNLKAMSAALEESKLQPAVVEWFHWGEEDFSRILDKMSQQGVEAILLVANAPEGKQVVKGMAKLPRTSRLPIISHWGITGGNFHQEVGALLVDQVDLQFLQTYSFLEPTDLPRSAALVKRYCEKYSCQSDNEPEKSIIAPTGTAHAYDLIHLLGVALQRAGVAQREAVQKALEQIPFHRGLVKSYQPPFTTKMHDALSAMDFRMARYGEDGTIVPQK